MTTSRPTRPHGSRPTSISAACHQPRSSSAHSDRRAEKGSSGSSAGAISTTSGSRRRPGVAREDYRTRKGRLARRPRCARSVEARARRVSRSSTPGDGAAAPGGGCDARPSRLHRRPILAQAPFDRLARGSSPLLRTSRRRRRRANNTGNWQWSRARAPTRVRTGCSTRSDRRSGSIPAASTHVAGLMSLEPRTTRSRSSATKTPSHGFERQSRRDAVLLGDKRAGARLGWLRVTGSSFASTERAVRGIRGGCTVARSHLLAGGRQLHPRRVRASWGDQGGRLRLVGGATLLRFGLPRAALFGRRRFVSLCDQGWPTGTASLAAR